MPNAGDNGVPSLSVMDCVAFRLEKQYQGYPRVQDLHEPQGARHARITKSPGWTLVTSSPTDSMIPEASCPSRKGKSSFIDPSL